MLNAYVWFIRHWAFQQTPVFLYYLLAMKTINFIIWKKRSYCSWPCRHSNKIIKKIDTILFVHLSHIYITGSSYSKICYWIHHTNVIYLKESKLFKESFNQELHIVNINCLNQCVNSGESSNFHKWRVEWLHKRGPVTVMSQQFSI